MTTDTPDIQDFHRLVEIVAEQFRVDPQQLIDFTKKGAYKTPRHVVAAIYSNWATLQETADLLHYKCHQSVYYSRRRVQDLMNEGRYSKQLLAIMDKVEEELPLMLP